MTEQKKPNRMHLALWVVQSLLAAAFGMSGFMKITMPIEELAQIGMTFVNHFDPAVVRFIGVSEVLGAIGLIMPAALRIQPVLTPLAAAGLAVIMIFATSFHVLHNEPFLPSIVLFSLAAFVAWGRFKKAPIPPKH